MVFHMVLLRLKKSVTKAKAKRVLDSIGALRNKIRGIESFAAGPYSSPEGLNAGFTHGFCMTFTTVQARDAYLTHPEHEKVKAKVLAVLDGGLRGVVAFDFVA